jgi:uncharacterized membrane protein
VLRALRTYLITGLIIWLPLLATVLVVRFLVRLMDRTLVVIPPAWRPEELLGFSIPGLGVVLAFLILLLTGLLGANFVGRRVVDRWHQLMGRIPLVRSVYNGARQVAETVFSDGSTSFKKVMLVQHPRPGLWALCFQTATGLAEVQARTDREVVCVFLPTTPNPTSGFLLFVPKDELVELDMSVDEALRMIISLGVVIPPWKGGPALVSPQEGA